MLDEGTPQLRTGALPDPPDMRDFRLAELVDVEVAVPGVWPQPRHGVRYQGGLGSCVAFAGARADEHWHDSLGGGDLAEQWLYGACKAVDGYSGEGTYPRVMMDILLKRGCPREQYQPYEGRYPPTHPPQSGADQDAARFRIGSYAAVYGGLDALKWARYVNGPLVICVKVHQSFEEVGRDGIIPMPFGPLRGGHALCWDLGWDERGIEVANSWSDRWGDDGHCFISAQVWDAIGMGAWTVVDDILVPLHWSDWPYDELPADQRAESRLAQHTVWKSGIFYGYPDGKFYPGKHVTQGQVMRVAVRLGLPAPTGFDEWKLATRGWVKNVVPGLSWAEERWDERLTRYQLALLVARRLQGR